MIRKDKIGKYWKAGFFFSFISSIVGFFLARFSNYVPILPSWVVITILLTIFIALPLFYGILIEFFSREFEL